MSLENLCESLGIPSSEVDYKRYSSIELTPNELLKIMMELDTNLNHNIIIIGGQTTNPNLLGYRQMRKPSTDIDTVISAKELGRIKELWGSRIFYTRDHKDLFLDYNGVPVDFLVGKIHDWVIPKRFIDEAVTITLSEEELNYDTHKNVADVGDTIKQITVAAPEYTITLKLRRAHAKARLFGKDKIDITNLLLAPYFKPKLQQVNLEEVSELLHEEVTDDYSEVTSWLDELHTHINQLRRGEKKIFEEVHSKLRDTLRREYTIRIIY